MFFDNTHIPIVISWRKAICAANGEKNIISATMHNIISVLEIGQPYTSVTCVRQGILEALTTGSIGGIASLLMD